MLEVQNRSTVTLLTDVCLQIVVYGIIQQLRLTLEEKTVRFLNFNYSCSPYVYLQYGDVN